MAVDAARNIVRNKTTQKGTKRDAAQKTSSARNTKKGKITPTPEAVATLAAEDDANNFEPDSHTEPGRNTQSAGEIEGGPKKKTRRRSV
jgi:hypothetical protein